MKKYYLIGIKDVKNKLGNISFLEDMYPDLYELYLLRDSIYKYDCSSYKVKRLNKLNIQICKKLNKYNLPENLIFIGNDSLEVEEILSHEKFYFSTAFLESCRVSNYSRDIIYTVMNDYTPQEIMQVHGDISKFCKKKNIAKIITFKKPADNSEYKVN